MPLVRVTGPKGNLIVKAQNAAAVGKRLPALIARFGKVTVSKLTPAAKPASSEQQARARAREIMLLLVAHEPSVHYAQVRPMRTAKIRNVAQLRLALTSRKGITLDCSEFVTLVARLAGAPDPNGLHYNGFGYTGTMLDHLKWVPLNRAKVGDPIVYGGGSGHHVCMVLERGVHDPLVVSHGQERGPLKIRHLTEAACQPPPWRALNLFS